MSLLYDHIDDAYEKIKQLTFELATVTRHKNEANALLRKVYAERDEARDFARLLHRAQESPDAVIDENQRLTKELAEARKVFDRIKAMNSPEDDAMPMYISVAQDCGGKYASPDDGWRACVHLQYDHITVANEMGGTFAEAVNAAIDAAMEGGAE